MKKWIILGILAVVTLMSYNSLTGSYNNMVSKDETVSSKWSQVENVYQRRADLIPNLVNTVKGYADFEKSTLTDVIQARANATSVKIDPTNLTPEAMAKFQQSQGMLSQALGRLMVVSEKYPELKANENFKELMAQLEGTENRIAVERSRFNESAQDYNQYIRTFPRNLIAGSFGFQRKAYFEAEQSAKKAPTVSFN